MNWLMSTKMLQALSRASFNPSHENGARLGQGTGLQGEL